MVDLKLIVPTDFMNLNCRTDRKQERKRKMPPPHTTPAHTRPTTTTTAPKNVANLARHIAMGWTCKSNGQFTSHEKMMPSSAYKASSASIIINHRHIQ